MATATNQAQVSNQTGNENELRTPQGWGLVRGQFGGEEFGDWLEFLAASKSQSGYRFNGFEHAAWEFGQDLRNCANSSQAAMELAERELQKIKEAVARVRSGVATRSSGAEGGASGEVQTQVSDLSIFTVAVHLQGQALGDEPSVKTLQFVGGEAEKVYRDWRRQGNEPPKEDPYYVPEHVGKLIHQEALEQLLGATRFSAAVAELQGTTVTMPGFVGAPAHRWSHFFEFPPRPKQIGEFPIPDAREVSGKILLERFSPVWDLGKALNVKFGLEAHPGEFASGDLASADEFMKLIREGGYEGTVGFNYDGSHMQWQGCDPLAFIRQFGSHIYGAHLKGAFISTHPTPNGLLGGHMPMGHHGNGWNFTTAGGPMDSMNQGQIISTLRDAGYNGPINIEWEDPRVLPRVGALAALDLRSFDLPRPQSDIRHDDALRAGK